MEENMRKRHVWYIALAVALLGLVAASLSLSAGATPNAVKFKSWQDNPLTSRAAAVPASHGDGQRLVVRTTQTNNRNVDVEGDGQGPGDYFVFKDKVYNKNGDKVGRDNGQCTINFPANETRFSINCAVAFTFTGAGGVRRGKIMVEGNLRFTETTTTIRLPITGGSRHYENVRGEVHVGGGNTTKIVFDLLP
jgi:hypothetical protein